MIGRVNHLLEDRTRLIWIGLSLASMGYVLAFLILAGIRLVYPYELEWIEGTKIDQMRWILSGRPLYGPPDIHFIPFAYTPFFFYLSAGLMKWIGVGFIAPRLISILSALGCFLVIFLIVRRHTGQVLPGVIAAGVYAACFQLTGVWMDLAKVDSLFMLLILLAFLAGLQTKKTTAMLLSGFLFALAFFTKQLVLPLILIFAPITLLASRGKNWPVWATTLVLIAGAYWIGDWLSDGWFSFYTLRTILTHPRASGWWSFWQVLLPEMWPSLGLLFFLLITQMRGAPRFHLPRLPAETWVVYGFVGALILTSWSIFFKIWTYRNDLMPACAGLAILAGLGAAQVFPPSGAPQNLARKQLLPAGLVIPALLLVQFISLLYNPLSLIPTHKEYIKGGKIVERTRSLSGEVLFFMHGYYNYLAGKDTYLHTTPLGDVIVARFPPGTDADLRRSQVVSLYQQALSTQVFDWLVVDKGPDNWLPEYIPVGNFIQNSPTNYPGRDQSMIPNFLLKKNPLAYGGDLPLDDPNDKFFFAEGWSAPAAKARAILSPTARLNLALENQSAYQLVLEFTPYCVDLEPAATSLKIAWESRDLGEIPFDHCGLGSARLFIPAELISPKEINTLVFTLQMSTSFVNAHPDPVKNTPLVKISRLSFIPTVASQNSQTPNDP